MADFTTDQINRIAERLRHLSPKERSVPNRVASVIIEEIGPDKSLKFIERAFANGMINAQEYYGLRTYIVSHVPREQVPTLPPPWAGAGSRQLIGGQKVLQQDIGAVRKLTANAGNKALKALEAPAVALNQDINRIRRAWRL